MTKLTLIDSQTAGISGDMLLGALIDAGANIGNVQQILNLIPQHFPKCKSLWLESGEVKKHGFRACGIDFKISEDIQETEAQELVSATQRIADASNLSEKAKSFAASSIRILVDAESKLHGVEISRMHLHEAGSTDTLADIFGVASACDSLRVFDGEVYATPVAVGGGSVSFSHGRFATPAPAVLEIASQSGMPIVGGPEAEELATPTGVSMLVSLTKRFLETYPAMIPERVGYGAGKKELSGTPNMLRVVIGRNAGQGAGSDIVQLLETNIDDLPGEMLGHALQRILDSGAKDAWITAAQFKKNRPGHVLHAICDLHDAQKLSEIIMKETGTLGVRYQQWSRFTLQREIKTIKVEIAGRPFDVRVKVATDKSGRILRIKPEFGDIHSIAQALSIPARDVSDTVTYEARRILGMDNVES